MGACLSRIDYDPSCIAGFEILQLEPKDTKALYSFFRKICATLSKDMITSNDLFKYLKIKPTLFICKMFSLLGSFEKVLDFNLFVLYIWNFCSLRNEQFGMIL